MANKKISDLTGTALVRKTDLYEKVDGVSGASEKALISQLMTAFGINITSNAPTNPIVLSANGSFQIGIDILDGDVSVPSLNVLGGRYTFSTTGLRLSSAANSLTFAAAALLVIESGANQRAGNLVLVGGTKTVANTTVTANTIVLLTRKTSGGTIGTSITYTLNPGVSFSVTSDNVLDTSTFSYMLVEVP